MPDLGTLLDLMKDCDHPDQPAAAAALSRYEEICSLLGTNDMHREVKMIRWNGKGRSIHLRLPTIKSSHLPQITSNIVFRLRFTFRTVDMKTIHRNICTCSN